MARPLNDSTSMDPPFQNRQYNFRVYRDFMEAIPVSMRSLPVYLTETDNRYATRSLDKVTHLTIHHSAAPANMPIETIAAYHVNNNDWPSIGYHFCIGPDGAIYQVNRLETISYHWKSLLHKRIEAVQRLAGKDFADTKRMLDDLAQRGQRFQTFNM